MPDRCRSCSAGCPGRQLTPWFTALIRTSVLRSSQESAPGPLHQVDLRPPARAPSGEPLLHRPTSPTDRRLPLPWSTGPWPLCPCASPQPVSPGRRCHPWPGRGPAVGLGSQPGRPAGSMVTSPGQRSRNRPSARPCFPRPRTHLWLWVFSFLSGEQDLTCDLANCHLAHASRCPSLSRGSSCPEHFFHHISLRSEPGSAELTSRTVMPSSEPLMETPAGAGARTGRAPGGLSLT